MPNDDGFPTVEDVQQLLLNEPASPIGPDDPEGTVAPVEHGSPAAEDQDEVAQAQGGGEETPPEEKPKDTPPAKPKDTPKEEEGEPDSGDGVTEPPPAPTPAPAAQTETEQLRAKLELLEQSNREMREFLQAQQAAPAAAPAAPAARQRVFNLDVPPKLADDLGAEDAPTRNAALRFLVNAIAEETYHKAMDDMKAHMEKYVPVQVQAVTQLSQEQESTRRDFYTTFPELDQPGLHATVVQVAEMVMKEYNTTRWSQPLKNEIGRRVKAILAGVPGAATPSPTPAPAGVTPAKRQTARVGTPGARPAAVKPASGGFAEQAGDLLGVNL